MSDTTLEQDYELAKRILLSNGYVFHELSNSFINYSEAKRIPIEDIVKHPRNCITYQASLNWTAEIAKLGDSALKDSLTISCQHIIKSYTGLKETYNYCTKCNEKVS